MLKRNIGFTLIELLAVIAILAIVILVVVPKVISTVENAKKQAFKQNAQLLVKAIDLKKATEDSFDVLALNVNNVKETLNADATNYESLELASAESKINMTLMGANVWEKYVVTGTTDNLIVMNKNDFISASILKFVGNNPDIVACNVTGDYIDSGIDIVDPNNPTAENIYSLETISLSNIGSHFLHYTYTNPLNAKYGIARNVIVENTNKPIITIDPDITEMTLVVGDTFTAPTATATDICEGDLEVTIESDVVTSLIGTYTLTYKATNSGNKTTTKTITVTVADEDITPPVITMLGSTPITIIKGTSYTDAGATALDNIDGNLTVTSTSTLVTTIAGTHTITYSAIDARGNAATPVIRTINVIDLISTFSYTGTSQTFNVPVTGIYKIELWGADTEQGYCMDAKTGSKNGGYVSGDINLNVNNSLHIYVGNQGKSICSTGYNGSGWNGGANGTYGTYGSFGGLPNGSYAIGKGGGGATDVRLIPGGWDLSSGLSSRIMVAGGGTYGPAGGVLSDRTYPAVTGSYYGTAYSTGSTQTSGGNAILSGGNLTATVGLFGKGGPGENSNYDYGSSGGAGGYYGGAGSIAGDWWYNGARSVPGQSTGGSSYISGHTGCVAIKSQTDQTPKASCTSGTTNNNCSIHYSNLIFTNTKMIDGTGYNWTNIKGSQTPMPSKTSGQFYESGIGNTGTGYARITFLSSN